MSSKNVIPLEAGHTYIADIREYLPPLGQSEMELSQVNTFQRTLSVITDTCVEHMYTT